MQDKTLCFAFTYSYSYSYIVKLFGEAGGGYRWVTAAGCLLAAELFAQQCPQWPHAHALL